MKRDVFDLPEIKINLLGDHQLLNGLTALLTLEIIKKKGYGISPESIIKGFSNCRFPGRFEIVSTSPLIILDGGHNIDGISSFTKMCIRDRPMCRFFFP